MGDTQFLTYTEKGDPLPMYQSQLFTQLIIRGNSPQQAMVIAEEATNKLKTLKLPVPVIIVG